MANLNGCQKDVMHHSTSDLTMDEMRVFIAALRAVVCMAKLDAARKEREIASAQHNAVSYRMTLADICLAEAEKENRGAA